MCNAVSCAYTSHRLAESTETRSYYVLQHLDTHPSLAIDSLRVLKRHHAKALLRQVITFTILRLAQSTETTYVIITQAQERLP